MFWGFFPIGTGIHRFILGLKVHEAEYLLSLETWKTFTGAGREAMPRREEKHGVRQSKLTEGGLWPHSALTGTPAKLPEGIMASQV